MTTVIGTLLEPDGDPATGIVTFYLVGDDGPLTSAFDTSGNTIVRQSRTVLVDGAYTASLTGNDDIIPTGTVWARSYNGGRIVDTLDVPAAGGPYDEADILADPPAALDPSGLAVHAANETLHGGGTTLGAALLTDDVTVTNGTATDIEQATLSFVAPDRDYVVEWAVRLWVVNVAAVANVQLHASIGLGSFSNQGADGVYAAVANQFGLMTGSLYVPGPAEVSPNSPDWHKPVPGDTVNYKLVLQRVAGTGNAVATFDHVLFGKCLGYIRAYQV